MKLILIDLFYIFKCCQEKVIFKFRYNKFIKVLKNIKKNKIKIIKNKFEKVGFSS